jgi:hypothetical protein
MIILEGKFVKILQILQPFITKMCRELTH